MGTHANVFLCYVAQANSLCYNAVSPQTTLDDTQMPRIMKHPHLVFKIFDVFLLFR